MTYDEYLDGMMNSGMSGLTQRAQDVRDAAVAQKRREIESNDPAYREYLRVLVASKDSRLVNYALDAAEQRGIDLNEPVGERVATKGKRKLRTVAEINEERTWLHRLLGTADHDLALKMLAELDGLEASMKLAGIDTPKPAGLMKKKHKDGSVSYTRRKNSN